MSILNQMLKDLEKRRKGSGNKDDATLHDVYPTEPLEKRSKKVLTSLIIIIALLVAIIFAALFLAKATNKKANLVAANNTTIATKPAPTGLPLVVADKNINLTQLQSIQTIGDSTKSMVLINLARPVSYNMAVDTKANILTVILNNTYIPLVIVPQLRNDNLIKQVTFRNFNNNAILQISFATGTEIEQVAFSKIKLNQLQLDLSNKNATPLLPLTLGQAKLLQQVNQGTLGPVIGQQPNYLGFNANTVPPGVMKVSRPFSFQSITQLTYQKCLNLVEQNKLAQAERQLTKLVHSNPNYTAARKTLALVLIRENKLDEAEQVLTDAIRCSDAPVYYYLLARVYIKEGKLAKALATLQKINPPLRGNTQYYALMAGLMQRLGYNAPASGIYMQLIEEYNPDNSVWLMGLGMSFEGLGKYNLALEAYRKAAALNTLKPQLQGFVVNRIQVLSGDP